MINLFQQNHTLSAVHKKLFEKQKLFGKKTEAHWKTAALLKTSIEYPSAVKPV